MFLSSDIDVVESKVLTFLVESKEALKNKYLNCRVEAPEPMMVVALWEQGKELAVVGILVIKGQDAVSLLGGEGNSLYTSIACSLCSQRAV